MELDFNFDFDLKDFDININLSDSLSSKYMKPKYYKPLREKHIKYEHAEELADNLKIEKNSRHFAIVSGNFIFGDLIEAIAVKNNILCKEMIISTLSMSQDNIDSLANLINGGYVEHLDLIVSAYFYSHERNNLIPYMYEKLDIDDKFQLSVAGTHCKTCQFLTAGGKHIIMHGSANLRSSGNIEQIMIEENEDLYNFNKQYQCDIIETYHTIKKPLRRAKLWEAVQKNTQV